MLGEGEEASVNTGNALRSKEEGDSGSDDDEDDPLSSPQLKEKPYLLLGFAIDIYFKIMGFCIGLLFIIALLGTVNMGVFNSYDTFDTDPFASLTLGNMGYSETKCSSVSLAVGSFILNCNAGSI